MKRSKYNKGKKAPAFILNLYRILQQSQNSIYVCWRDDEESFIIKNVPKFSEIVLPKYYKHSNYSSFVRQLNMYNFNKLRSQFERQHIYQNQLFTKNGYQNLKSIKRREVISNKNSNLLSLTNVLNNQFPFQNNQISSQYNSSSHISQIQKFQIAAASPLNRQNYDYSIIDFPSYDGLIKSEKSIDFPNFDGFKLTKTVSDYLIQTQKINYTIPPVIPLRCEQMSQPIESMINQMKQSQNQLENVFVDLYKQNQFLNSENKRLQQKLKTQYTKKEQILNQIIKYVINFLSEWNANSSQNTQSNDFFKQKGMSDQQSSSDIILQSYDMFQGRKFQKKSKYPEKKQKYSNKNQGKSFSFSKYAQNQKKILLTLLKEIQKSYSQKFFYTGTNLGPNHQYKDSNRQFHHYPSNSANSFLMSMLLKFIESNNLTQVIKRFSLLINLERNKKSKNFTVVNCMKDLTQHFNLIELQQQQKCFKSQLIVDQNISISRQKKLKYLDKQRFLQNQKQTIIQMQKQLDLIAKNKQLMMISQQMQSKDSQMSLQSSYIMDSNQNSSISYVQDQVFLDFFKRRSSFQENIRQSYRSQLKLTQECIFKQEQKVQKQFLQRPNARRR